MFFEVAEVISSLPSAEKKQDPISSELCWKDQTYYQLCIHPTDNLNIILIALPLQLLLYQIYCFCQSGFYGAVFNTIFLSKSVPN